MEGTQCLINDASTKTTKGQFLGPGLTAIKIYFVPRWGVPCWELDYRVGGRKRERWYEKQSLFERPVLINIDWFHCLAKRNEETIKWDRWPSGTFALLDFVFSAMIPLSGAILCHLSSFHPLREFSPLLRYLLFLSFFFLSFVFLFLFQFFFAFLFIFLFLFLFFVFFLLFLLFKSE